MIFHQENPELFGWSFAVVLSGSMEPAFSAGDLLLIHRQDSYRQREIVTFSESGTLITHRIAEETEEGFVTKGDANNAPDENLVSTDRIYGKVAAVIPGVGKAVLFLRRPAGLLGILLLSGLLFWGGDIAQQFRKAGRNTSE